MNNKEYNYLNFKNYKPVVMHGNCVYWIEFDNNDEDFKCYIHLMKYDLNIEDAEPEQVKSAIQNMKTKDFSKLDFNNIGQKGMQGQGSELIGATGMFAENKPELSNDLTETEFLKK